VYDTLELVALAVGGIGGGQSFVVVAGDITDVEDPYTPWCAYGLARFAAGEETADGGPVRMALVDAGIDVGDNDQAVAAINERRAARHEYDRVPFAAWCAELNVIRGAA
jgi:hypothetical protein